MIKLLGGTDLNKIKPREFIVADTDLMSIQKIKQFETKTTDINLDYTVHKIYRSRNVGQSYFTSVFTTLLAFLYTIPLVFRIRPELLIVNGPGTCLPICVIVFVFSRLFLIPKCKIVFVESICRVKSLCMAACFKPPLLIAYAMKRACEPLPWARYQKPTMSTASLRLGEPICAQ